MTYHFDNKCNYSSLPYTELISVNKRGPWRYSTLGELISAPRFYRSFQIGTGNDKSRLSCAECLCLIMVFYAQICDHQLYWGLLGSSRYLAYQKNAWLYIWGCMYSTGPFQFRWLRGYIHSSCYYHYQIVSINLTHYNIFPRLCAWDVCYIIFRHLLHINSGKTGILFSLLLYSLWWVQIFGYVLACRSCSFVCTLHHLIIIIVQTYLRTLNL